jgi:O-antigen/teichoic acid export membrane protein
MAAPALMHSPAADTGSSPALLRTVLTLLAGGALAQLLPLLLGPLLTRLYTPQEFGLYHLFMAVATNAAVVACARYEFALPLARDEDEGRALLALSVWLLLLTTLLCSIGAAAWSAVTGEAWPMWLPLAVLALGSVSLATLLATREQRFKALAAARVVQHGGGALAQAAAGAAQAGLMGLVVAPLVAAGAAVLLLVAQARLRLAAWWRVPRAQLIEAARRHRSFPLLNTPHAFNGALLDTLSLSLIAAMAGAPAAGFWGLTLRYLKAPATLVGSAVSQALYPRLAQSQGLATAAARADVVRVMLMLGLVAAPLVVALWLAGPWAFARLFGEEWRAAGELARGLALYIGVHFVASPLAVVTMAWNAQGWALRYSMLGQLMFLAGLAAGLAMGGLQGAGWGVSAATLLYFGWYFWKLATWPLAAPPQAGESQ